MGRKLKQAEAEKRMPSIGEIIFDAVFSPFTILSLLIASWFVSSLVAYEKPDITTYICYTTCEVDLPVKDMSNLFGILP